MAASVALDDTADTQTYRHKDLRTQGHHGNEAPRWTWGLAGHKNRVVNMA